MTQKRKHKKPENHLAAVEAAAEGNYNMIDGIINNEPPKEDAAKPSILAQLERLEDTPQPKPPKQKHNLER